MIPPASVGSKHTTSSDAQADLTIDPTKKQLHELTTLHDKSCRTYRRDVQKTIPCTLLLSTLGAARCLRTATCARSARSSIGNAKIIDRKVIHFFRRLRRARQVWPFWYVELGLSMRHNSTKYNLSRLVPRTIGSSYMHWDWPLQYGKCPPMIPLLSIG